MGPLVVLGALVGLVACAWAALGRWVDEGRTWIERLLAAGLVASVIAWAAVRVLGLAGAIRTRNVLLACAAACAVLGAVGGRTGWRALSGDVANLRRAGREALREVSLWPAWGVAFVSLASAMLAAWMLPPWAWDGLGYHLSIVHDALQTGALRRGISWIPYVDAYPRHIDLVYVAVRVLLPDDTWIDAAQAPFGLLLALATAALAARSGVGELRSLALGALTLTVPVTMLQMAADYVDVAYAAFVMTAAWAVTGRFDRMGMLVGMLGLGMLLGSKPSAPLPAAVLSLVWLLRAHRAQRLAVTIGAIGVGWALGCETYVRNVIEHGNPVWPVIVGLGAWRLPGEDAASVFFDMGVRDPYLHCGTLRRVLASWFEWPSAWVYDMRIGGLGPMFTFGLLPLGAWAVCLRPTRGAVGSVALVGFVTLATPGAFWARYTLAWPAALLVLAGTAGEGLRPRVRSGVYLALAALASVGLAAARRGFTDGGATLVELAASSASERMTAASVDGHERDWMEMRARVRSGEAVAYDASFGLPGLLWCGDGRARVLYLATAPNSVDELVRWTRRERVRVIVLGDEAGRAGPLARAHGEVFRELFPCPLDRCRVYEVLAVDQRAP